MEKTEITHQWLCESLAYNRDSMFVNVTLGSAYLPRFERGIVEGPPRADVVSIHPSYNSFCLTIYEIKQSRADLQSDLRSEKWRKYLPFCHRFYFAVRDGIAIKREIPQEAGLIVYKGDTEKGKWSFKKSAGRRDIPQDERFVQMLKALIFHRQTSRSMKISEHKRWDREDVEHAKYMSKHSLIETLADLRIVNETTKREINRLEILKEKIG